ncbi:sulfatase-like hydrolase/transferase [Algibacter sp. 2305UL17-15]|uniref:sulfatase-like hydrolase/transferase n=1 Tax=Algibacter sp. 2305UL17-15 TaxID=3231268 RepID=UPI00345A39EC
MISRLRFIVTEFIKKKDVGTTVNFSILAAVASGLYPMLHYYDFNFSQVNSKSQILFFVGVFLVLPCISFLILYMVFKKIKFLKKYQKYSLPILNHSYFLVLIILSMYGFRTKVLIIALLFAAVLGVLFYKHIRKILVFQFLLAVFSLVKLMPDLYGYFSYSKAWMQQPDTIESVHFKKKPNVYIIQPDGYANFSELKKDNYNFDNSDFEESLSQKNFKLYEGFRSNYKSTLSSNSSLFVMKHHYYNKPKPYGNDELYNSRDVIIGENPVVSIFKNNDYKTFLILEKPYLLINRPKMLYDYCNYSYKELPFTDKGFSLTKTIDNELKRVIQENKTTNNFYFIEKMLPNHIAYTKESSRGKNEERKVYLESLKKCNDWLLGMVSMIIENDENCMIVIVSDHGGYVGMNYMLETLEKQENEDLVQSAFTAALAIKWPDKAPEFDTRLKTNVNLFRVLFSYLSEDESYLKNLQEDKSYGIIKKNAPFGVYELINNEGDVVFNKYLD